MEYEEKLNLAKKALETGSYDKSTIEYIFPELKESEDERVKRILYSISSKMACHLALIFTEEEFQCFDAWSNAWIKEQCDKSLGKLALETVNEKSADKDIKTKPKFKVGDWITNSGGHSFHIGAIGDSRYFFDDDGHTHEKLSWEFIKNADEHYALWSLEDARDGDILVRNKFNTIDDFDYIFIYNKTSILRAYCYYSKKEGRASVEDRSHCCPWSMTNIKPATKKQRDFLTKKMIEIGCSWDGENKAITRNGIKVRN